ncbi:MAG: hypothetical protein ACE5FA_06470, partial [Dehalococcoidia bacterium]
EVHQTDNSTAATHRVKSGKRDFNEEYVSLVEHFKMKPRTTAVGQKEQNGDVEASNGALKRALEQRLLIRCLSPSKSDPPSPSESDPH